MAARCPYDRCDGSGFLLDAGANLARPCECRAQLIARRRISRLEGRIPHRYKDVGLDRAPIKDMDARVVRAVRGFVRSLDDKLDRGDGLWLQGPQGTGKTTLAMAVSKAALQRGRTVAIYSLPRLLSLLRDCFRDDSDTSLGRLIDDLCAVDLLHVDDIGAEQTSPWVLEQVYTIFNTRYEDRRSVLVTTNLEWEQLTAQIGARTSSRLVEMCGDPIPVFGDDRRVALAEPPGGDERGLPTPEGPAAPRPGGPDDDSLHAARTSPDPFGRLDRELAPWDDDSSF